MKVEITMVRKGTTNAPVTANRFFEIRGSNVRPFSPFVYDSRQFERFIEMMEKMFEDFEECKCDECEEECQCECAEQEEVPEASLAETVAKLENEIGNLRLDLFELKAKMETLEKGMKKTSDSKTKTKTKTGNKNGKKATE